MTAPDLLDHLLRNGFSLRVDQNGRLLVSPSGKLHEREREAIRTHRDDLCSLLNGTNLPRLPLDGLAHVLVMSGKGVPTWVALETWQRWAGMGQGGEPPPARVTGAGVAAGLGLYGGQG